MLRVVFMGTAQLSCTSLEALVASPAIQVLAVVTQPDRPKGRDLTLRPSPVKELSARLGLPVMQPELARSEQFIEELRQLRPDLIAVAAYGQILPPAILDLPRYGCLNVHTSLLPKYRGAAPIQWAILNDDQKTGVTIMKMDEGLDTGAIVTQEETPILPEDTAQTVHDRLAKIGASLLLRTIPDYAAGIVHPRPQPAEGASHARKIKKQDGLIDWCLPARTIWNRVRGLVPWPGAFTSLPGTSPAKMLKIWQSEIVACSGPPGEILQADSAGLVIACGHDALRLLSVQRDGGTRMTAQAFLAGHPLKAGQNLKELMT